MNKYEKLYKIGLISEAEYKNKLNESEEKTLNLDSALENKLEKEFKKFKNELKKKSKLKIMNSAYELTVKEEIKDYLIGMNLFDEEKQMLISQDDILQEFYNDWLDSDVPLGDSIKECLEESVATLSRYYDKHSNQKER